MMTFSSFGDMQAGKVVRRLKTCQIIEDMNTPHEQLA